MGKYIVVTGGVMSSIGKGIVSASIALLLKSMGLRVTAIKIDPYLNVDAGTMNPYAHGEVYVTYDGGETDLDIGHYERFLDTDIPRTNNITSGQIYLSVITKERRGDYLGSTVQLIPHVTDEIKARIRSASQGFDAAIVELGGTVGDYEQLPFLEAVRQMRLDGDWVVYVHVAWVPVHSVTGEFKTKPLQHSVAELRRYGIQPDAIVVRSEKPIDEKTIRKISLFTNVPPSAIFNAYNVDMIYKVPLILRDQGMDRFLSSALSLGTARSDLGTWSKFVSRLEHADKEVVVGMCGKYVELPDSYLSIVEALRHAGAALGAKPVLRWCNAERVEQDAEYGLRCVQESHAVIVLPGFGKRGSEGMIECVRLARTLKVPFLGICFGMQLAVVEYARNVLGLKDANSTELDPETPHPVVHLTPEQRNVDALGGTMILGDREVEIVEGTLAHSLYGSRRTVERHRHRYEVNLDYLGKLTEAGLVVSGWRVDVKRVEIIELPTTVHPFFIATQFHPEFRSRPLSPRPVFLGLLRAALENR